MTKFLLIAALFAVFNVSRLNAQSFPVQPGPAVTTCPAGSGEYLAVPCYVNGDPLAGGTTGAMDAFVVFPYGSGGKAGDPGYSPPLHSAIASQIGACWATSYDPNSNAFYTAAVLHRHMGLGPLGLGGIYKFDMATGQWSSFLDVDALPGVNLGTTARIAYNGMPLGANELGPDAVTPNWDVDAFAKVGKTGLGGMDFSADGNTLWVMNLNNRELLEIDVSGGTPSLTAKRPVPNPGSVNGTYRPWAVKVHNGKVFVGMTSDASSGGTPANLKAHIRGWDPGTSTWGTLYDFPLNYNRDVLYAGNDADWRPWSDTAGTSGTADSFPQPLLSDLEFDMDGSIIVSLLDRYGLQKGYQNYAPNTSDTTHYNIFSGGDLLRVGVSGAAYILENNGVAGSVTTSASNTVTPAGPGGKEFYWGEYFNFTDAGTNPPNGTNTTGIHTETAMGSIAFKPGSGEVVTIAWDPYLLNNGGVITMSNTNGTSINSGRYEIYPAVATELFGKGVGLGDVELICIPDELSIGNLVFFDNNGNGIYDAGDTPAEGVTVELYTNDSGGGAPAATMITGTGAQAGCYLFENLIPGTHTVKIAAKNFRTGGVLIGWESSAGSASGDDDEGEDGIDSADPSGPFVAGIRSSAIQLGNTSPSGAAEGGKDGASDDANDAHTDLTIDFGLVPSACTQVVGLVGAGRDDGYELRPSGSIVTGTVPNEIDRVTRDIGFIYSGGLTGVRFDGIFIPKGAIIDSARILFSPNDANGSGNGQAVDLEITAEAADDPVTYASTTSAITNRDDGSASVTWIVPTWNGSVSSADTATPDIKSLVQELVNRSGWASGNAMAFQIGDPDSDGTIDAPTAGTGTRTWETFEGAALRSDASLVPHLSICYHKLVTLSGKVEYNNGAGNQPMGGVNLTLLDGSGDPVDDPNQPGVQNYVVTTSGVDGSYTFAGLSPGTYQISQTQPSGYGSTSDTDGSNNNVIGDQTPITLTSGQSSTENNFLEVQLGAITGAVLVDTDNNGSGDAGIGSVTLTLLDSTGTPVDDPNQPGVQNYVVTSNSGTGAYSFTNLMPGNYQVSETQPSGYDSVSDKDNGNLNIIGDQTLINVTAGATNAGNNFVEELPASIGDFVFLDVNVDGIQGGAGEVGIDGIPVRLLDADNGNAVVTTVITSGGGGYLFKDLTPGNYIVEVVGPDGYAFTLQDQVGTEATDSDVDSSGKTDTIAIVRGNELTNVDAGLLLDLGLGAIGNYVWLDENGDGLQNAGETGIPGVAVELLDAGNSVIASTTTDANGGYLFNGLGSANYSVCVNGGVAPAGMDLTKDPDAVPDNVHAVSLAAGEEYFKADFGYNWVDVGATVAPSMAETGTIGNRVWSDADGDGKQDPGEAGIPGLLVTLYSDPDGDGVYDNVVQTANTDSHGNYVFDSLPPGGYVIGIDDSAVQLLGATQTGDPDGKLDDKTTVPVILGPGDVYVNADFGYQLANTAMIGDTIYFDANASGTFDGADSGIAGVTVALINGTTGDVMATTTTSGNGTYSFPGLPKGVGYRVEVSDTDNVLGNLVQTGDPDGGNDGKSTIANLAANNLTQDFGYAPVGHSNGEGLIGGTIFIDMDGDGNFDSGEGREGVRVELWNSNNTQFLASTATDENGHYYFGGLGQFSSYNVRVDTSGILAGLTNTVDPNTANPGNSTSFVNLAFDADGIVLNQDFGYVGTNIINGVVWQDLNADGSRIPAESTRFGGVTVSLRDSAGNVVGSTITNGTGIYSFTNVPDGSYTVDVTDTANILDGSWHSLGADSAPDPAPVTVNGGNPNATLDFGYFNSPALVGDFVWNDINGDGDQDGGELGIGGVKVTLKVDYPNGDSISVTAITPSNGSYSFQGLLDEDYTSSGSAGGGLPIFTVTAAAPSGYTASPSNQGGDDAIDSDDPVAGEESIVAQGGADQTNDFGYFLPATIGNYVWLDENGDGVQNEGESGISSIVVELLDGAGSPILDGGQPVTTMTDSRGGYLITGLAPGNYQVRLDVTSVPAVLDEITFDPQGAADGVAAVTVVSGGEIMILDFGLNYSSIMEVTNPPLNTTGSIGDRVWNDADGDGLQDAGEAGIGGVTVELFNDLDGDGVFENSLGTRTTNPDGTYVFANQPPGTYLIEVTPPAGTTQTGDPDGTMDSTTTIPVVLAPGDVYLLADFGYDLSSGGADIGDTAYLDVNANGSIDSGETGIPGVTVALLDAGGNVIATTTTDSSGSYVFPGLPTSVNYTVKITDTDHVLGELVQSGDPDGGNDGKSVIASLAADDLNQDFGYIPWGHATGKGLIGDTIFLDLNGSNSPSPGEGIEGVTVTLKNTFGDIVATTTTSENGNYTFGGLDLAATYTVEVDPSTLPEGLTNTVDPDTVGSGNNGSSVDLSLTAGVNLNQDFGYRGTNSINGVVWNDTDADGELDETGTGFGGVTVQLRDPDGNVVATTTTLPNGNYSFSNVPDGTFTIDVTDTGGLLSSYWHSLGVDSDPDPTTVTVNNGNPSATADFGYFKNSAALGNFVWYDVNGNGVQDSGEIGIAGAKVTLIITYPSGDVVTRVDVTDSAGHYDFGNLLADESFNGDGVGAEPTFSISVETPTNFEPTQTGQGTSLTDSDDPAGTVAQPVKGSTNVAAVSTEPEAGLDFGFTSAKQDTFASWQTDNLLGGSNGPTDNPDGDIYNNALEYALCLKPEDGTPTTVPGGPGGFCAELNGGTSEVDAFYVRAEGPTDVTFTLQTATTPADPTSWTDRTDLTPTTTTNGNGTETVRYTDLETSVGTTGLVRLKAEIAGDATGPHTTQVWGWNAETVPASCQTWSNPYAPKGMYSGTATNGDYALGVLTSTAGGDVSALLGSGEYYIEMIGGTYEGHRFDLNEGAATATGIAIDTSSAHNTLSTVPATLAGAYELRKHTTLDAILPPSLFTPNNNSGLGDRLLLFANGAWQVVWVYDQSGGIPAQWTDSGNSSLDDVGDVIVEPCQGLFTHPRAAAVGMVTVGVVRSWDFACPLNTGYNLVGGGYPQDISPEDRVMLRDASDGVAQDYFTSNANPVLADQLLHWLGDDVTGVEGYRTYYNLYLPSTVYDYWTDQTNSNLTDENVSPLFKKQRGTFYDIISGHDRSNPAEVWVWPAPWTR